MYSTRYLRLDICLVSESTKNIIIIDLTVLWEDCVEEAQVRKRTKYEQLVINCHTQGGKVGSMPIEVRCRGFVGRSLHKALSFSGCRRSGKKQGHQEPHRSCSGSGEEIHGDKQVIVS